MTVSSAAVGTQLRVKLMSLPVAVSLLAVTGMSVTEFQVALRANAETLNNWNAERKKRSRLPFAFALARRRGKGRSVVVLEPEAPATESMHGGG